MQRFYNFWVFSFWYFATLQTIRQHCFIYSLDITLFAETNSSWLIFESTKALEIKTSTVFNLVFANSTIISYFFFFLLIIGLYFSIPAVITETFIVIAEFAIPTGITTKEAIAAIGTHPVTVEPGISKCSV